MPLRLDCPGSASDTGAYRISWRAEDGALVRVDENETLIYEGPESATTVSGRPAGDYVYRIGFAGTESWEDTCTVSVAPPSLGLAFLLFGVGLSVFASLVVVVVQGHRAHRRGELSS